MADASGITPPYLDPSQYPAYLDMQRKQMLANALLGATQQAAQTPQDWNSMRVVPRMGLGQVASALTGALLSRHALNNAYQAQQNYFSGMYGNGGQQAASGATPPNAPQVQPTASGATPPAAATTVPQSGGNSPTQPTPTTQALPSATSASPAPGGSPLVPGGMDHHAAQMLLGMLGPEKYAETFLAPQYSPTDFQRNLRAAGIDPGSPLGRQLAQIMVSKSVQNNIDVRPGGTIFDQNTGRPVFTAPQNGVQLQWDDNGTPSASNVTGAPQAAGAMTAAETAARVSNTPLSVPTASGGEAMRFPGQVPGLGAPPAFGNGAQIPGFSPTGMQAPARAPAPTASSVTPQSATPNAAAGGSFWSTMPKMRIPQGIGQGPGTYDQESAKLAAAKRDQLGTEYGTQAANANQQLFYNQEALRALPGAEVGPMSNWLTTNRQALIELGVPASLLSGDTITPTLELNKYLKNAALQGARSIYGPRMTQTEVKLQTEEMSPSASMTADAIRSLIQQNNIKALYAKQQAADFGKFVQQGGDPRQFEQWYENGRSLPEFANMQLMSPQVKAAALARFQQHPETRGDFVQAFGWDPTHWQ